MNKWLRKKRKELARWVIETKAENDRIFQQMKETKDKEHVHRILAGKNLALLDKLLKAIKHPDVSLVNDIKTGMNTVGPVDNSNLWSRQSSEAECMNRQFRQDFKIQTKSSLLEWADISDVRQMWSDFAKLREDGTMKEIQASDLGTAVAFGFPVRQGNLR